MAEAHVLHGGGSFLYGGGSWRPEIPSLARGALAVRGGGAKLAPRGKWYVPLIVLMSRSEYSISRLSRMKMLVKIMTKLCPRVKQLSS